MAFAMGFAPVVYLISVLYRRRFQGVILMWKRPQIVVFTILAFIANLVLFVMACLFFASYMGQADGIQIFHVEQTYLRWLTIDCLLLLTGITVLYLAVQNFFTQFVTLDGIYLHRHGLSNPGDSNDLLRWEHIKDYYVHSDYPITLYTFLVEVSGSTYSRRNLKVPFYMLSRFEQMLDQVLKQQQELRQHGRSRVRGMPKN